MKLRLPALLLSAATAIVACAPARFTYAPVATTSADVAGTAAAAYALPGDGPAGNVHVAVLGVTEVPRNNGTRDRALRVSLLVTNRSPVAWRVDGGDQHVELASEGVRVTLDAMKDDRAMDHVVDVAERSTRWVDFLFVIPEGTDDSLLDDFDVIWTVEAGGQRHVTRRTRFEKLLMPPARPELQPPADPHEPAGPPATPTPPPAGPIRRPPPP